MRMKALVRAAMSFDVRSLVGQTRRLKIDAREFVGLNELRVATEREVQKRKCFVQRIRPLNAGWR